MNTAVTLTPGFSSLVFEFWRFDFGCISFYFLIRIRDAADHSDHDVSKETKSTLGNVLVAPLLYFVPTDLSLGDHRVISRVRKNSRKGDPTVTYASLQDDGITNPDPNHPNGINAPCIILN